MTTVVRKVDIDKVAEAAVVKTLLAIGIDISTPESVLRAQDNYSFLDRLNRGQKAVRRKAVLTAVGTVVAAAVGYLLLVFGWGGTAPAH